MLSLDIFVIPAVIVAVIVICGLAFWARYRTVGPEQAMIVTGSFLGNGNAVISDDPGRKVKIVRGGGAFIWPVFQQSQYLSLLSHKLDISTPEVYTSEGVPVLANGVAIIKVGGATDDIATAAEQFLGKPVDALKGEAREVLEGHLRAILGGMTVEEVYRNRDKFAQEVQGVAARDLKKMGLQIVSFTIKDVQDNHGYLDALGKPRIAAVKRDAEIAEAEAVRDARIRKALAEEEGQKAELLRDTSIAEATKTKELKVAAFRKEQETAKADADQAYQIQEAIAQQRAVEEQMKVELVRKEREIDLKEKEILVSQKQYDADVKKKADADKYAVEQAAEAEKVKQMRLAEASQYTTESQAKASAEKIRLDGLAQAESAKAKGAAEAEVIRLRGLAEAEARERQAEAFEKFGQAAVLDIVAKMLPELAGKVAAPLASIDKLTVVDSGNGSGALQLSQYVTQLMATAPEMLKNVSGIDVTQLVRGLTGKNNGIPAEPENAETSENKDKREA
ncbi:flotillin family protein [Salmonella enterica]|nr:flotillin family protein [Salmonella enterica]ELO0596874.1 flotillin family protein [Salmonella enterica]